MNNTDIKEEGSKYLKISKENNASGLKEVSISISEASSSNGNLSETILCSDKRLEQQNLILDYIREHPGINMWQLSKALNLPNSTIYYKVKDLELGGVITSKIIVTPQHRSVRLLYSVNKQEQLK